MLLLPGTLCDRRVFEAVLARMPDREVIVADMTGAETACAKSMTKSGRHVKPSPGLSKNCR